MRPVYKKEFSRDLSLAPIQIWCDGESLVPKQWTTNEQPHKPYIVCDRVVDTMNCYMDPMGVAWAKEEVARLMDEDDKYADWLCDLVESKVRPLQPLFENPKALDYPSLVKFLDQWADMYPPFEGLWWLMEVLESRGDPSLQRAKEVREMTNCMSTGGDAVVKKSLLSLYPELGSTAFALTLEEIKTGNIPEASVLKERQNHYVYIQGVLYVNKSLEEVCDIYNIEIEKIDTTSGLTEIPGQIACRGRVIGRVKRVMGSAQNDKVEEGDVLVTAMTMPDMIPAMKKAVAFVTDEGGIMCHAAIVAREMNKPCIIATKIATEVLKDGDMVEVDADKGVVRKI